VHVGLREILAGVEKFSVKFVVQKFKIKFQSLFKISKVSLTVVSTLVMGKINRNKATAAVKYAGSKSVNQLTRDTQIAKKSGSVPVMGSSMKKEKFTELPGIKLLQDTTDREQVAAHWTAIEEFVGAIVFFVSDVKGKLAAATKNVEMFHFDNKRMDDINEVICEFDELFDICTSWLGSEFEGEYQKIQRFLKKCPAAVQEEYALFISPKLDGERIDELTMNWAEFCSLIRKVWESSFFKMNIRAEFGLQDGSTNFTENQQTGRVADRDRQQMRVVTERPSDVDGDDFKLINCVDCKSGFVPSLKQVQKFKETNNPLPDKCPKCKGQVCDKFREDGVCPFGEGCKFLHPDEFKKEVDGAPVVPADGPRKHSYSCRFYANGNCMSGDQCRFQHGPPEAVHSMSEVDTAAFNMLEIESSFPKEESLAVEVYKGRLDQSGRFGYRRADASKYRYV